MNSKLPKYIFDWKGFLALFVGAIVPAMAISFMNVVAMMFLKENFQYNDFYLMLLNAVMWVGAILGFDLLICRPQTGKNLNFNFSTKNVSTYFFIFPLMLGMMFIAEFITGKIPVKGPFFGPMYEWFSKMMEQMTNDFSVMFIMAVVMAPIFEEIVFRGILQKGLINKGWEPTKAIWVSAIVFGVVHGNPWQFVGAVLLGYVLGLVYHRTKSLLMPILLHAFNNGVSTILLFYGNTESFSDFFGIPDYLILMIGIVLFAAFYYLFTKKYEIAHAE